MPNSSWALALLPPTRQPTVELAAQSCCDRRGRPWRVELISTEGVSAGGPHRLRARATGFHFQTRCCPTTSVCFGAHRTSAWCLCGGGRTGYVCMVVFAKLGFRASSTAMERPRRQRRCSTEIKSYRAECGQKRTFSTFSGATKTDPDRRRRHRGTPANAVSASGSPCPPSWQTAALLEGGAFCSSFFRPG